QERIIVGVNAFNTAASSPIPVLKIDAQVERDQIASLDRLRKERHGERVKVALAKVAAAAQGKENLVPPVLEAVRAYASLGEVCDVCRSVWGAYREWSTF